MVKLHRIDSDFYTFFLPGENESDPPREYQVVNTSFLNPYRDEDMPWTVFDNRNRHVGNYFTLSDIRTSF